MNIASRLMEADKQYGNSIGLSSSLLKEAVAKGSDLLWVEKIGIGSPQHCVETTMCTVVQVRTACERFSETCVSEKSRQAWRGRPVSDPALACAFRLIS